MANQFALWLDREGLAEMSCIAGVGGGVPGLVRTAHSGRRILALDGCAMACVAACLTQADKRADHHVLLSKFGVKKHRHADFDPEHARAIYHDQIVPAAAALSACSDAA